MVDIMGMASHFETFCIGVRKMSPVYRGVQLCVVVRTEKTLSLLYTGVNCNPIFTRNSIDVDECGSGNGGCAEFCNNTDGSFECSCRTGYMLAADDTSCEGTQG